MKPARIQVRTHGSIFCLAVLFGLCLLVFHVINRGQLLYVSLFLMGFGEVVFVVTRYCGPTLEKSLNTARGVDNG